MAVGNILPSGRPMSKPKVTMGVLAFLTMAWTTAAEKAAAVDGTADTPSPVTGTLPRSIIESIANVFSIKKPKRPIEHEPISP
jgi:hypothetical protein